MKIVEGLNNQLKYDVLIFSTVTNSKHNIHTEYVNFTFTEISVYISMNIKFYLFTRRKKCPFSTVLVNVTPQKIIFLDIFTQKKSIVHNQIKNEWKMFTLYSLHMPDDTVDCTVTLGLGIFNTK